MKAYLQGICLLLLCVALVSCSQPQTETTAPQGSNPFLLTEEPGGAKDVKAVCAAVKDGDAVTVVGRIGGSEEPFTQGRAVFTIVDRSFTPCNERPGDNCKIPWDYCCDPAEELAKGTVLVKFVDAAGKTRQESAKTWLGVRELDTVVVRGVARRDEEARSLVIVADGIYVRAKK